MRVCDCGYNFIKKEAPLGPFAHLQTKHPLYGIHGWLMLFCASQAILSPVFVLFAVVTGILKTPFLIAFQLALCGFAVYTGVSVWRMRPNALKIVNAFLFVMLVLGFVGAFPPQWMHLKSKPPRGTWYSNSCGCRQLVALLQVFKAGQSYLWPEFVIPENCSSLWRFRRVPYHRDRSP